MGASAEQRVSSEDVFAERITGSDEEDESQKRKGDFRPANWGRPEAKGEASREVREHERHERPPVELVVPIVDLNEHFECRNVLLKA